ncbi:hypothetical protein AB0D09_02670 [Streptomyces sp. NPDC049097]|uniref:hypothetical protein n=1 Tax=Streptomyces sp. NPDC049097 TaxID=3155497 RepID=UPI00343F6FAE
MTARKTPASQSWDDFWAEVSPARTEVIRGIEVRIPTDLPLVVEKRANDLRESSDEEDIAELLQLLFGVTLDEWRDAGMGLRELQTVLTWGLAQASGVDMTFAEAYETVLTGDGEGKALGPRQPNRAARRAASKPPSKSTGGRSGRTSAGSTASARKSSRG